MPLPVVESDRQIRRTSTPGRFETDTVQSDRARNPACGYDLKGCVVTVCMRQFTDYAVRPGKVRGGV
jgi:hypothetical protein